MNCASYQEEINQFIDGEMDMRRQVELFQHLAGCTTCQSFIDAMVRIKEASRNERFPYPADLDDAVLGDILSRSSAPLQRRDQPERKSRFWNQRIALPLPLAASFTAIIVAVGILLGLMFSPQSGPMQHIPALQTNGAQPQTVILIYGMPPVEILGTPTVKTLRGIDQHNN
jgi:hypothetical protein